MELYYLFVEVDDRTPITRETDVDPFMEVFGQYDGAPSTSPRGYRSAGLYVPATSLGQAVMTAAAIVGSVFGAPAIACEAMTEGEFLARVGWEDIPELASVSQVAELLGVTRAAVLDRIRRGTLQATKVGETYAIPRHQPGLTEPESV